MPSGLCQYIALLFVRNCAGERGKSLTAATCVTTVGESHSGGAAGRNSFGELNSMGFQPVAVTFPGFVPTHIHLPVGTVPVHTASEPSALARAITRSATWRPSSMPAV